MFDVMTDRKDNGEFYCNFQILTDHYKKCSVKMWQESVRIYPREGGLDTYEFSRIIHSIEGATGSELYHDPTED